MFKVADIKVEKTSWSKITPLDSPQPTGPILMGLARNRLSLLSSESLCSLKGSWQLEFIFS